MKLVLKRLLSRLPTPLPVGLTAFHAWADEIIELSGNFADEDSMKYAIANNLIHLSHTTAFKPKHYFVSTLRKAAANQVASQVFMDIKVKQEEKQKAASEAAKLQQAAVTTVETSSDGQAPKIN